MDTSSGNTPKGGKLAAGKNNTPMMGGPRWTRSEKPKDFKGSIMALMSYLGKYRWAILTGVLLAMASSVLSVIGPQFIKEISDIIYNGIFGSMDTEVITRLSLITIGLYACSILFGSLEKYIIHATSERVANRLRNDLTRKINRLPLNYYDNSSTGDIMSRLTNDADTVGSQCGMSFSIFATSVTTMVGCVVMMFYTDVTLATVCVIPPIVGFVVTRTIIKRSHGYYQRQSRNLGAMNGLVEETYRAHDVVGVYGNEEECRKRFTEINDELYVSAHHSRFISSMIPQLMNFVGNIGYVLVCVVGSMLIMSGSITYGVIVAFIVYVRMFNGPMTMISEAIASMQSLAASSERIFDLLLAPEMDDESSKNHVAEDVKGDIEFRNVTFGYIEGVDVIHDYSLKVEAGQKIAIVGPTGAGKTTIINLLMRFYEVDEGDILIDGTSVRDLSRAQVHEMFSMVLQDPWLFDGTVKENLVFNRTWIDDGTVVKACKSVGIHDFITRLPEGYDSKLKDSAGMSAGQRQQITIARAIIKDAPMIIFDEATSSLDTNTERMIQGAMNDLTRGRTSFIIAHRLQTIMDCDRIIVMDKGRIVETGNHEELLAKGGFYAELFNSQFVESVGI